MIGLGAMGAATAFQLGKRGADVIGIDRYCPPHAFGASWGDTRITRQAIGEGMAYVPLVLRSHEIWRELEAATGASISEAPSQKCASAVNRLVNEYAQMKIRTGSARTAGQKFGGSARRKTAVEATNAAALMSRSYWGGRVKQRRQSASIGCLALSYEPRPKLQHGRGPNGGDGTEGERASGGANRSSPSTLWPRLAR